MNSLHEAMKMHALLAADRQFIEKKVHQPGLPTPYTAPQIQTFHILGRFSAYPVQQSGMALTLQGMPQLIERLHGLKLMVVLQIFTAIEQ